MNTSELVTTIHLSRKAVIYVRQSTPHQVLTNQESLSLQYALKDRAMGLGWRDQDIEIIDSDLGSTGAAADHREGFKELVTKVTVGQVGLILSSEVTRLSRNCSDWYPLLDICGFRGCLIADRDGIYDPGTANGRLLLGLKGTLSEMELYTIRARLQSGLLNKAQRGELAQNLPVGLQRDELGRVQKDPDREIQQRIGLIFQNFSQVRSATKVLGYFHREGLLLPRRDRFGDVAWKPPTVNAIVKILKNPAYAGAFVYGRTKTLPRNGSSNKPIKRLQPADWRICVKDKYPAYISWETFEKIQAMLRDNHAEYDRAQTRGVPRGGKALLHGLLYCGECGHKMSVHYKQNPYYVCEALHKTLGVGKCQYIPSNKVDQAVVTVFFEALSPVELDVYARAMAVHRNGLQQVNKARLQQVERLRYQATLAHRQFNRVDPDNRLVAAELEARWETALRDLKQAETEAAEANQVVVVPFTLTAQLKSAFTAIGQKLPEIWDKDILSREHKKALLRCLIDKVVLHRVARDQVQARIIWVGGDTTTLLVQVQVGSIADLSSAAEMTTLVLKLAAEGLSDKKIAAQLTAQGYRSPMGESLLPSTVATIRLRNGVIRRPKLSRPRQIDGFLTIPQLAKILSIPTHYIYDRINKGTIDITKDSRTRLYLFPNQPATIELFTQLIDGRLQKLRF
jgi:DNA invertase Pin-like site-specific DNA recombinase